MPEKAPTRSVPRSYIQDDPSAKIWTVYLNQAEKEDQRLAEMWRGDMDSILIFAGLFSASVTAFIIESYKTLIPDNSDSSVLLLVGIYQQLAAPGRVADPNSILQLINPTSFVPPTSALICNTLWFLSLGCSLTCTLCAVLVQQWTRHYLQSTSSRESPYQRARISAYLYQGLKRFRMQEIVAIIPILLHMSLLLFFAGLVEFLRPVNLVISYLVLVTLLICGGLYTVITLMPLFTFDCPYRTPLTPLAWNLCQSLNLLARRSAHGSVVPVTCNISKARELDATEISQKRDDRDYEAMCWALERLQEDSEIEPFVEFIPEVVAGFDYSAKLLIHRLLDYRDDDQNQNSNKILQRLDHRIYKLLRSCLDDQRAGHSQSGHLHSMQNKEIKFRRAETCLKAIWSLTMMSPLPVSGQAPLVYLSRKEIRFDETTLKFIQLLKSESVGNLSLEGLSVSTLTSVTRSLLDMFVDQTWALENDVADFMRTGRFSEERVSTTLAVHDLISNLSIPQLLNQLMKGLERVEAAIRGRCREIVPEVAKSVRQKEMLTPNPTFLHQIDGLLLCLNRLTAAMVLDVYDVNEADQSPERDNLETRTRLPVEVIDCIRKVRVMFFQAGMLLTVEYMEYLVGRLVGGNHPDTGSQNTGRITEPQSIKGDYGPLDSATPDTNPLPYETLNTIRRLYLKSFQDSVHSHLNPFAPFSNVEPATPMTSSHTTTSDLMSSPKSFSIYPELRTLLLEYLQDALNPVYQKEGSIQESVANVLLGLVGMVVDSEDSEVSHDHVTLDDVKESVQLGQEAEGRSVEASVGGESEDGAKKLDRNTDVSKAYEILNRYLEEFPESETAIKVLSKITGT